jgi:carboxymethylenebutenolidase
VRTLTRPEGTRARDLDLSRRGLAGAIFGGYAAYAFSASAEPIHTDETGLTTETVQLAAGDRLIPAYVARPQGDGRFPAVVVISEVFGIHEYIRDVCRRLAKLGYAAIAPDFFVRAGDPSGLTDFDEIRKIVGAASEQQVMNDLGAALAYLKVQDYVDRKKLGVVGFCWGGAAAWQASARFKEVKAAVAWYGRLVAPKPGEFLGEPDRTWPVQLAGKLHAPVLGLYAGKDQGISSDDIQSMRMALWAAGRKDEIIVYPEAEHGFHADYRASYDAAAAQDGWRRMLEHLRRNGVAP